MGNSANNFFALISIQPSASWDYGMLGMKYKACGEYGLMIRRLDANSMEMILLYTFWDLSSIKLGVFQYNKISDLDLLRLFGGHPQEKRTDVER